MYSLLACNVPKTNHQEGLKKAYQLFQLSAGAFRYLIDEVLPDFEHPPPLALDKNTLESLVYLNLAQAQECFWLKAVTDGLKNIIIAKLANEVFELYATSLNHCNRSSILKSEWVEHIACKKFHFNAAAQYRASIDCLDRSKYGEEVARLKACVNSCSSALKHSKYISSVVLNDLQGLNLKAKSDLVRSEKDNDLIYLQEVVSEKNLPPIGRSSVSKPIVPPGINTTLESAPFSSLLPYVLYQTSRAFQEKIEAYVQRHITNEIDSLNNKLHSELQRLSLPGALDAVEKPLGVPQTLVSYSEEIRANGGVPRLNETFQDITRLSIDCQKLFKEANDTLNVEESEDNSLRSRFGTDRWTRPESKEAAPHLWEKLEMFQNNLTIASNLDKEAKAKLQPVESLLTVLSQGQASLEQFLPHATVVKLSPVLEQSMTDLRAAISKCRGIELDRAQYLKILQAEVNNVDLLSDIVKKYNEVQQTNPQTKIEPSLFESVYTQSLGRFDKTLVWIQEQADKQRYIIQVIERRNQSFLDTMQTDDTYTIRQNAVQSLEQAYSRFNEVRSSCEQALIFYNGIIGQLQELVDASLKYVYERRYEGRDLEEAFSSSTPELAINNMAASSPLPAPKPQQPNTWDPSHGIKFS